MKKVLLHICCAPCMIYPRQRLREAGYVVDGYYYNPNIHPAEEYALRRKNVELYSPVVRCPVTFPEHDPQDFFAVIPAHDPYPGRCLRCWELRLMRTAKAAKAGKYDAFTTTLLVSPYQDQEALKAIGEKAQKKSGVTFFYEDFRIGFREAQLQARTQGIYCQRYCGCSYSEAERSMMKHQKKIK